jgi:hypothetical protein
MARAARMSPSLFLPRLNFSLHYPLLIKTLLVVTMCSQIRMESGQKQGALFHAKAKITKLENRAKFAEVTGVLYNQWKRADSKLK